MDLKINTIQDLHFSSHVNQYTKIGARCFNDLSNEDKLQLAKKYSTLFRKPIKKKGNSFCETKLNGKSLKERIDSLAIDDDIFDIFLVDSMLQDYFIEYFSTEIDMFFKKERR